MRRAEAEQISGRHCGSGGGLRRRAGRACALLGLLGLVVALPGGCGRGESAPRNLLLITVDTLRSDHLGAWGYGRGTSPAIDALAAGGVVFEDAYSHTSWTLPSLATLMTSLYTSSHGAWDFKSKLPESVTTLAEILTGRGYRSGAVVTHVFAGRKYGMHQGFVEFDEDLVVDGIRAHVQITSPRVTAKGLEWIRRRAGEEQPWFLWLHYFDPHGEYMEHPGISAAFGREEKRDLYDGEIAFTDRAIGSLLRGLEELGRAGDTVVVLTADHGEEFAEHGRTRHGKTLYEEVIRVPLIVRAPGLAPGRVQGAVPSVDLLPTLLELMDLPAPAGIEGASLVAAMEGAPLEARPVLGELRAMAFKDADSYRRGRWKVIREGWRQRDHLYDLETDPAEQVDLAAEHPDRLERMLREMDALRGAARGAASASPKPEQDLNLTPDELEGLRQLGYLEEEDKVEEQGK
ncbi:MAG: sulfatase [Deltaproteobacteria bacterium]|nr:sulfatase [Deltaproteobacteria bacterium]MBW2419415.1 sulfatase [Deltaproteobacteria bacterium]